MKIIFVQLTYNDFLNDPDFVKMTLEEKGAYFYLILFLFSKNGPADFENLWRAIGCRDEKHFQEIWDAIGYKFKIKNGKISHKMVASEISRIRKLRQAKRKSGLKGAKKRWHNHNFANGINVTNEIENGNVIENGNRDISSNSNNQSLSSSNSLRADEAIQKKALEFIGTLNRIIPPKNRSDRTSYKKVTRWLITGCRDGKFGTEMFFHALKFAREAKNGDNPQALFMSLLKQLGYHPKKEYE